MPRLLLRSSRGLVNALEVLSIIKHYGGIAEISGSALQSFYAPRVGRIAAQCYNYLTPTQDAFTKRPLGFVFIEADQSSADAILAAGTQYVKAPLPSGQSRRSTAGLTLHQQAARNRISLQDILNLRASPLATGLQADSADSADQPEEEDRILEITAEAALGGGACSFVKFSTDAVLRTQTSECSDRTSRYEVIWRQSAETQSISRTQ